jgi:hypothetical protein
VTCEAVVFVIGCEAAQRKRGTKDTGRQLSSR